MPSVAQAFICPCKNSSQLPHCFVPAESSLPLRSVLDKRSTFHFGHCWTRGLHSVPVVAGQAVYVPLRSLLDACHWHAATLALSNAGTQRRALRFAYGATRTHTVLSSNVRASGQAGLPGYASSCRAFIVIYRTENIVYGGNAVYDRLSFFWRIERKKLPIGE